MIYFFLLAIGSFLTILSYESIEPAILSLIFLLSGYCLISIFSTKTDIQRSFYLTLFCMYWLMVGVSSIYVVFFDDYSQLRSDAATFFELSTADSIGLDIEDISRLTEGSGAVYVWRLVYDFFSLIGFEKERYVGLLINILAVSFSGIITLRMLVDMFGNDIFRIKILKLMFLFCGLFWLFVGIHVRDAVVLLAITSLSFYWLRYVITMRQVDLVKLVLANILSSIFFIYLRQEFTFVPLAMGFSGIFSIILFSKGETQRMFLALVVAFLGLIIFGSLFLTNSELFMSKLTRGHDLYSDLALESSSSSSLGMSLVVNQPLPIRLVVGCVYLFVFPIPFWAGLLDDSVYQVFKSLNALFFYFITPLFAISIHSIVTNKSLRTDVNMFLLLTFTGFTLAIAATSLETRHFGAFLPLMFLVCLIPDLSNRALRKQYQFLSCCFIGGMLFIHLIWFVLRG